ncbi:hypothetical protein GCM10027289_05330 [Tsukamurella serpentis]
MVEGAARRAGRGVPWTAAREGVRVGPLDVLNAHDYCAAIIGPVQGGSPDEVHSCLQALADELGAQARIGLRPRTDSRIWEYDSRIDDAYVVTDRITVAGLEDLLADLISRPHARPVEVGSAQGYVSFAYDHGMGDGNLYAAIISTVSGAADHDRTRERPELGLADPMRALVRQALAEDREEFTAAILANLQRVGRRIVQRRNTPAGAAPAPAAQEGALAVVTVRSGADLLGRLDARRKSGDAPLSRAAVISFHLHGGLVAAGFDLVDEVEMLVDLRRATGPGAKGTLANVFAVVDVPLRPADSLGTFESALTASVRPARAVARLLTSLVVRYPVHRIRQALPRRTAAAARTRTEGPAHLTITDLSQAPALRRIHWIDDDRPAVHAVAVGPGTPAHIAVAVTEGRGVLNVTATFDGGRFPAERVREGIERALREVTAWIEAPA